MSEQKYTKSLPKQPTPAQLDANAAQAAAEQRPVASMVRLMIERGLPPASGLRVSQRGKGARKG